MCVPVSVRVHCISPLHISRTVQPIDLELSENPMWRRALWRGALRVVRRFGGCLEPLIRQIGPYTVWAYTDDTRDLHP